jgi:ABC-type sugar transport system ATPase subunit
MNVLPAGVLERSELQVGIRPEHVLIARTGAVRARVTLVEHLGHEDLLVHLRIGESRDSCASRGLPGEAVLRPSVADVGVAFDAGRAPAPFRPGHHERVDG